jgi:hypothetical protein
MPIPNRLQPPPPTAEDVAAYTDLCREIENGRYADEAELNALLARWNARAGREYTLAEFRSYSGSVEIEDFVAEMLMGQPELINDLTYSELRSVLDEVQTAVSSEAELGYYLGWLETNLPGANISDLIYWPNEWFADDAMFHVELTADQILAYAMARSGRRIPGAPENVPLPHPIPS